MKKVWKRFFVTTVIAISMATPVFGATFTDVADAAWYADQLDLMVEMGVVSGYEDGTFRPQNPVTYGEFAKMLCSLTGTEMAEKTENHWASGFAGAVYAKGWFEEYPSDLNDTISRYGVSEAVFNMMECEGDADLESPFGDIDDVVATALYDLDIMKGSLVNGETLFLGDSNVTRAELCAVLNRVVAADDGNLLDEEQIVAEEVVAKADYTYTLPDIPMPDSAGTNSAAYYDQVIGYMMVNDLASFTCEFDGVTWKDLYARGAEGLIDDSFVRVQDQYHELGSFYEMIEQSWSSWGKKTTLTISIGSYDFSHSEIVADKAAFLKEINKLSANMYADGSISEDDSDYNKALYFYKWCALNLQYDESHQPESYNGYGALTTGRAVCQGYTAIFNALCNASGIECYGISGDGHIWNYAKLDGTWLYVDATYGDPVPDEIGYCDPSFFGLTEKEILGTHEFDPIYQ